MALAQEMEPRITQVCIRRMRASVGLIAPTPSYQTSGTAWQETVATGIARGVGIPIPHVAIPLATSSLTQTKGLSRGAAQPSCRLHLRHQRRLFHHHRQRRPHRQGSIAG